MLITEYLEDRAEYQHNSGSKGLILGEQQYFVWKAAPHSKKWLDMLNIWAGGMASWDPWQGLWYHHQSGRTKH